MNTQGRIQKWGNSSAIRLPAKTLAAAGISPESEVDIQASKGRLVIQLHEKTLEASLDTILAEVPGIEELLQFVQQGLSNAIVKTADTTRCLEEARRTLKPGDR